MNSGLGPGSSLICGDARAHTVNIHEEDRMILGMVVGLYLVGRAIVEPFVIDVTDPATYRNDWGGPSLFGVLAVHCGPGLVAAVIMAWTVLRRRPARHAFERPDTPPQVI